MSQSRFVRCLVACLVLAVSPVFAQDNFCGVCKDDGLVDCETKGCKKTVCKLAVEHICAEVYSLECCRGQRQVPCTFCKKENVKFQFDLEMEAREKWLASMRQKNKDYKAAGMLHISTPHFNVHYDIPRIKVGMKYFDKNEGAHLYAQRLEELYDDYVKLVGDPYRRPQTGRWEIYICDNVGQRDTITNTVIGSGATKQFGQTTSTYVVAAGKQDMTDDEQRHANVYHHAAHLIIQQGHSVTKFEYPGWWTVGLAHWMERTKFEETRNFCTGEVGAQKDKWQEGGWPKKVYSQVSRDKEPRLASFEKLDTQQLTNAQHAFAWSMVDFILNEHRDAAGDIGRAITGSGDTAGTLLDKLGMTSAKFHDEWRAYVLKAYAR